MELKNYSAYIFFLLTVFFLYLSWRIIQPFAITVASALVLAVVFYPVQAWLNRRIRSRTACAALVILFIVVLALVPFALVANTLVEESINLREQYFQNRLAIFDCTEADSGGLCLFRDYLYENLSEERIQNAVVSFTNWLIGFLRASLAWLTTGVISFVLSLYIAFFLLVRGDALAAKIKGSLALKEKHEKKIFATLKDTTVAVVYGSLAVALIQGLFAGLGYWLIGSYSRAALLGMLTGFAALIPTIGSSLVWFPLGLYRIIEGYVAGESALIVRGIILLAYGGLFISLIDNVLKPWIIGDRAKIHPVIVLLGVLGGLKLTNSIIGIVIGPLILATTIQLIAFLRSERKYL